GAPTLRSSVLLQALHERGGDARAAGDDENRVVAGDRSGDLGQPRAVEGDGERLGLRRAGTDDDELLHALHAAQEVAGRPLERRARGFRARRFGAGALIRAVARALDEAEILDVARDGRLRCFEAARVQALHDLLLAVQRFLVDEFEDEGLPTRLHG